MSTQAQVTASAYEIERFVGAGGFGSVYRALDTRLSRAVAIKVLSGAIAADADGLGRFRQEARAAASLNHPHICSVHEVERDRGVDYIVMELVDGRPLSELDLPLRVARNRSPLEGLPIRSSSRSPTLPSFGFDRRRRYSPTRDRTSIHVKSVGR